MSEVDNEPTLLTSNQRVERLPPRADRRDRLGCFCRCRLCDWELINGEGVSRTRSCCPEGLRHDLDHGLTPDGLGKWCERSTPAVETKSSEGLSTMRDRMLADEDLDPRQFDRRAVRIAREAHEDRIELWRLLYSESPENGSENEAQK